MQIFGGELLDASGESPRGNWDEFVLAIFTTFQIMTLDGKPNLGCVYYHRSQQ